MMPLMLSLSSSSSLSSASKNSRYRGRSGNVTLKKTVALSCRNNVLVVLVVVFLLCLIELPTAAAVAPDVVAVIPGRAESYANGINNGMILSAARYNVSLEIVDYGFYDSDLSKKVLQKLIDRPTEEQPKIYCIWPVDLPSKQMVRELYLKHKVPILQLNQLPGPDTQWEWDHLIAYAGPDDALRARNAGLMLVQALEEKQANGIIPAAMTPRIVALGYPETYGGYHLSIAAFKEAIKGSNVELIESIPLTKGSQHAYNVIMAQINEMERTGQDLHGIYAMDDTIAKGAYQAIHDRGWKRSNNIVLVGTVCNGERALLRDGAQYGTTAQSPFLESVLAMDSLVQFLTTGTINETIRFTPNPSLTGTQYETMIMTFLGEKYVADDLCMWELEHTRSNGLESVSDVEEDFLCKWVECLFIPNEIFIVGYVLAGVNYIFAIASAIGLWYFRNAKIIVLAQPAFLLLVIFGAVIDTTSIIFMSRDNRNYSKDQLDRACTAWTTLLTLGQMVTTATLVAKIYRVRAVTSAAKVNQRLKAATVTTIRRTEVRTRDVSGFIIGGLIIDAILLGSWFGTDPFDWNVKVVSEDSSGFILSARGECASENEYYWLWPLAILVVHFSLLIYANILAYQTRHFHQVSDSKMVAICLFNSIQLLLVASVMLALSGDNVAISYVVRASYAFLNNVGVMALVVGPKLYLCVMGRGDIMPEIGKKSSVVSMAAGSQSPAMSARDANPESATKGSGTQENGTKIMSTSSKGKNPRLVEDSWAYMGSTAEASNIIKKLEDISENETPEGARSFKSPKRSRRPKNGGGGDTSDDSDDRSGGLEALLYPSEVYDMWESLGFPSEDHAKAVVDLTMKDTTPKRRQEIINGAFLRPSTSTTITKQQQRSSGGGGGGSVTSDGSGSKKNKNETSGVLVGYDGMISPADLRKNWESLGFFECQEAEYVIEILSHDTTKERRVDACEMLFDE